MTLKEIAELSGVSMGTVDRVIYKRGRVSAETRTRVEQVISRHGLTSNPLARSLKRSRPYRFCSLLPDSTQDAGYWGQITDGITDGEDIISQLGVRSEHVVYDRYNITSWNKAAETIMKFKPDGLIFAPVMPDKTLPFISELQRSGMPVIFVDADVPLVTPRCIIAQNSYRSGYFAGKIMRLYTGDFRKKVAILDAHSEDYHLRKRRDGFLAYTAEQNIPVAVHEYSGYGGLELPETEVQRFMESNKDLAGIFITNVMSHRVARVTAALKLPVPPCIIGYDLIPENRRLLAEGGITAIISQRPEEQGRQAILSLYRCVVLEQDIEAKLEVPINVYIKENVPQI